VIDIYHLGPLYLFFTALAATIVGGVLTQPILEMLIKLKSRQTVSKHIPEHAAKQGTPTMGGIIIIVGFLGGMAFALFKMRDLPPTGALRFYIATGLMFVVYAAIGFVDDFVVPRLLVGKRGLGWTQKLGMQILAAMLFVGALGRTLPLPQAIFGVLLILCFSNAYNFSDGLDALAGSLLVAMCLGFAVIAQVRSETGLFPILGALIGGALPFLWVNFPPAKVFMGDVGALPIGAVLGVVASTLVMPAWSVGLNHPDGDIGKFNNNYGLPPTTACLIAVVLVSMMMVFELVPVPLQILSVKLRKKKLFPATPIHHSFQRAGWGEKKIVATFLACQLGFSILGGGLAWFTRDSAPTVLGPASKTVHVKR